MAKTGEYVEGLRRFADFCEAHPDLQFENYGHVIAVCLQEREELSLWARALAAEFGRAEKAFNPNDVSLEGKFGEHIKIVPFISRDKVCTPKVVGKKRVLVKRPVKWEEEEVEQDVLEYDCGSLLAEDPPEPVADADFAEVADTVGEHLAGAEQEF